MQDHPLSAAHERADEDRIVALLQRALSDCPDELIDASGTPRAAGRQVLDSLMEQARREADAAGGRIAPD